MCNTLPQVSKEMRDAVNATYGDQERTRGEVRALYTELQGQKRDATPKSGTSPS